MNKYKLFFFIFALMNISFYTCYGAEIEDTGSIKIIPFPQEIVLHKGKFCMTSATPIYTNLEGKEKKLILDFVKQCPLRLRNETNNTKQGGLQLIITENKGNISEAYHLTVSPSSIKIEASASVGIFYGLQSLLQLAEQYGAQNIPALTIHDTPYLNHRGLMIDVSRHFFSKDFLKKQLDLMAYYKMNRFHWHLVDGTGWRVEIKKYPQLTQQAAWRPYENLVEWSDKGRQYCEKSPNAYGGYYTQEDVKEIVAYASSKYITVIPEIEMPGHSEEVLAVFPQMSCAGKAYVNSDFCIGNPETFIFLEDVLTEIMALFPSEYIHIGGDEAEKKGWQSCSKCADLMEKKGLKDVDELQSYMIHHIETFLNKNGRRLLGWDEIMQGGLAPNATVMSWRGEEYGIKAVQAGHDAIMTPIKYCYFNFYQDAPESHVLSWAGYTPIEKVYSYNPVPDSVNVEEKKHILGVQANVWTEYIPTENIAEMMIWPRALAIAETGWTQPDKKSFSRFKENALNAVEYLKNKGYTPFDLKHEVGERKEYYDTLKHLAIGKPVEYKQPFSDEYPAGGKDALVNGLQGGWSCDNNRWQGFINNGMDVVIDLQTTQTVHSIQATFMQDAFGWCWMPKDVEIYTSADSQNFTLLSTVTNDIPFTQVGFFLKEFAWKGNVEARYIRYVANPDKSNTKVGFIFTDEIVVR